MELKTQSSTQGRSGYSAEDRRELIEEFHSSGLTQAVEFNPATLTLHRRFYFSFNQLKDSKLLGVNRLTYPAFEFCAPRRYYCIP